MGLPKTVFFYGGVFYGVFLVDRYRMIILTLRKNNYEGENIITKLI